MDVTSGATMSPSCGHLVAQWYDAWGEMTVGPYLHIMITSQSGLLRGDTVKYILVKYLLRINSMTKCEAYECNICQFIYLGCFKVWAKPHTKYNTKLRILNITFEIWKYNVVILLCTDEKHCNVHLIQCFLLVIKMCNIYRLDKLQSLGYLVRYTVEYMQLFLKTAFTKKYWCSLLTLTTFRAEKAILF